MLLFPPALVSARDPGHKVARCLLPRAMPSSLSSKTSANSCYTRFGNAMGLGVGLARRSRHRCITLPAGGCARTPFRRSPAGLACGCAAAPARGICRKRACVETVDAVEGRSGEWAPQCNSGDRDRPRVMDHWMGKLQYGVAPPDWRRTSACR